MPTTATDSKVPYKWPVLALSVLASLASYFTMPESAAVEDQIGHMLRLTARIAFLYLMLTYVARPLRMLLGHIEMLRGFLRGLLRHRRYLGLGMAFAHTVHAGYVVALVVLLDMEIDLVTLLFGGGAFVMMWLMAITSNRFGVQLLGKNWRRLHLVGLHWLWFIMVYTFAGRISEDPGYLVYVLIGLAGLALRGWVYGSVRARRAR